MTRTLSRILLSRRALALIAISAVALLLSFSPSVRAQKSPAQLAVATENGQATRAALKVMQKGGNAIDAAVVATLVAGVASPNSSGIGGGGFALVWVAQSKAPYLIDFRETAPPGLDTAAFEARPLPDEKRGKLVGIPGEVRGLYELHQRLGTRPWSELVMVAANLAQRGFIVEKHLANMLGYGKKSLPADPNLAAVFYPGGRPAGFGALVKNPKLGATLARIAGEGPVALYEGTIARDLVEAVNAFGGTFSELALKQYRPVERTPLHVRWEGYDVYTMPPPSAGGLMVAQALKLFTKQELLQLGFNTGAYQHLLAEALRGSIADRMRYLGDPDHQKIDLERLLSSRRMAARKAKFALERTHMLPRFGLEEEGTHHLVTADAAGNVVALTTTVNRLFGAKFTGKKSGIVLNDELNDFTSVKDVKPFGMTQSPNRARAMARPLSSMTPTIVVKRNQPVLALGGSGGPTIATNVTQLLLSNLVFGNTPEQAVKAARFYVPTRRTSILLEPKVPSALHEDLKWRGEIVGTMPFMTSAVQMIAIDGQRKRAASDPRKHGSAVVR